MEKYKTMFAISKTPFENWEGRQKQAVLKVCETVVHVPMPETNSQFTSEDFEEVAQKLYRDISEQFSYIYDSLNGQNACMFVDEDIHPVFVATLTYLLGGKYYYATRDEKTKQFVRLNYFEG